MKFTDEADTDPRAAWFRRIAQEAGFDVREKVIFGSPGVVEVETFKGDGSDDAFISWENCCAAYKLCPMAKKEVDPDFELGKGAKFFDVTLTRDVHQSATVTVPADTEDEAREYAYELVHEGDFTLNDGNIWPDPYITDVSECG